MTQAFCARRCLCQSILDQHGSKRAQWRATSDKGDSLITRSFPSSSTGATLEKKSIPRRSHLRRHDQKNRKYRHSLVEMRDKRKNHWRISLSSIQTGERLKMKTFKSSGSSSLSCSSSSDVDRRTNRTYYDEDMLEVIHPGNGCSEKQLTIERTACRTRQQSTTEKFPNTLPKW